MTDDPTTEWALAEAHRLLTAAQIEIERLKKENANLATELGRKGGQSTSEAKRAAVRENGKKGGRPRKEPQQP
jgi:hypothetical protein